MRILHIMLNSFYVEGFSYQENILPKYHKYFGHDVFIISNQFAFDKYYQPYEREAGEYINKNDIPVSILKYKKQNMIEKIITKFIKYQKVDGLKDKLYKISPDIIFVHGGVFLDVPVIIKYCKENTSVKLYVDHHGDYHNSPVTNRIKKYILGYYPRKLAKYAIKYWGTTPWRVKYLQEVYGISPLKTDLLVMGGDDTCIDFDHRENIRKEYRRKINVNDDDFLIITGGKINEGKNIHLLIEAVYNLNIGNIGLVVFGLPDENVKKIIRPYMNSSKIHMIGWIDSEEVYKWYLAADMAVFPGTHSVLWEQALSCGLPTIFKYWEGMTHVDVGNNCLFLYNNNSNEIIDNISMVYHDKQLFEKLKNNSENIAAKEFSYKRIAKISIGLQ